MNAMVAQINNNFAKLDLEAVTKVIRGAGGRTAMISGKLPNGTFGDLYYDSEGNARILITATSPGDGEPVIAISKSGIDVVKALGG